MSYDPIANTITLPVPPCPFCGGQTHPAAINIPPMLRTCQKCGAAIPERHYQTVCAAMEGQMGYYIEKYMEAARKVEEIRSAARLFMEMVNR